MSRFPAVVATILGLAGAALAQTSGSPAPSIHPGTKLGFPPTLGGATFEQGSSQGGSATYLYGIDKMQIYIGIADGGRRIPPGGHTPILMNQFTTELNEVAAKFRSAGYSQFERPAVPSDCTYGSVTFRCIVYSVGSTGGRLFSKLLMTGYHDYFLKIRIDWSQAGGQTVADADKALQSFVPALVH